MEKEKKERRSPPYVPVGPLSKALKLFGNVRLNNIDKKTIQTYGIISTGNEGKILAALKFLDIIDNENNVNTSKYNALSFSGKKREEELSKVVRESYKKLFETIPNLEKVEFDILKNFFISEYAYSGGLAEAAVKVFVFFCKEAGIPLSEKISKKTEIQQRERKSKEKRKKDIPEKKEEVEHGYAKLSFITKDFHNLNFPINNMEDWIDAKEFIEKRLQKRFNNQGPSASEGDSENPPQ